MEKKQTNAWAITGFVIAVLGIFLTCIPVYGMAIWMFAATPAYGWILWGLGVVFSGVACWLQKSRGLAYAGLAISIFSLVLTLGVAKSCSDTVNGLETEMDKAGIRAEMDNTSGGFTDDSCSSSEQFAEGDNEEADEEDDSEFISSEVEVGD